VNVRDPLMPTARTVREATRDPYDWWEHHESTTLRSRFFRWLRNLFGA